MNKAQIERQHENALHTIDYLLNLLTIWSISVDRSTIGAQGFIDVIDEVISTERAKLDAMWKHAAETTSTVIHYDQLLDHVTEAKEWVATNQQQLRREQGYE